MSRRESLAEGSWARVAPELVAPDAAGVLRELAGAFAEQLPGVDAGELARGFAQREELGSTALGGGVAIPHCRSSWLADPQVMVGRHVTGVPFGGPDGAPVRLFVAIVSPASAPGGHLRLLADLARRLRDRERVERAIAASTAAGLLGALGPAGAGG